MTVSTIYQTNQQPKSKHKSIIVYILIVVGLLAVLYFGYGFVKNLSFLKGSSALKAGVFFNQAEVFLNDALLGQTPYESESIAPGESKITLKGAGTEYAVTINLLPNTEAVIKRDLGISQIFSAGQNFWLDKNDSGIVLSVISEPADANVFVDGTEVGKTPYSSSDLSDGDYDLRVEKDGYEPQTARIDTNSDHKLNVSMTLFPKPVPDKIDMLEGADDLYDVFSDNLIVTSDAGDWVAAVIYWNGTRGINLADVGVNKEMVFDYYIDYDGNLYDADGKRVNLEEADFSEAEKGAYMRKVSEGDGLTDAAKETYLALGEVVVAGKSVTILETGTGWLRVRAEPSLNGEEVGRVDVGVEYAVLDESEGWVKVQVSADLEGWVSDTYVEFSE